MKKIYYDRKILYLILGVSLVLVFSLTIVYAALSVSLNIVGTLQVQDASWNVYFDNIKVNLASVSISPKIIDNNKITFSADLKDPGDFYKFTVDIVNSGTIDAMIDSIIKMPELTNDQKKYLRYEIEYTDGQSIVEKQILKAKETKTISVLFSFRTDILVSDLPTTSTEFDLSLNLVYYQADNSATNITTGVSRVNVVSGDMDTIGSEICIYSECFNVISSTSDTVTMLAKYNLHTGYKYDDTNGAIALVNPSGIQDANARGRVDGYSVSKPIIGSIEFSSTNYWHVSGVTYPKYVYNSNSSMYIPMENYKVYLNNLGVFIDEIRPITYEEMVSLGCDISTDSCNLGYSWLNNTAFWTGSAYSSNTIYRLTKYGHFGRHTYNAVNRGGVRPVITISKIYF